MREPIPVDPDTGTTLVLLGLERSNCLLRRDRGVYVPLRRLSIVASGTFITRDRPLLFQPLARSSKILALPPGLALTPEGACLFRASHAQIVVHVVVTVQLSESYYPRLGPVTTAGKGVLFPDFGKMSAPAAIIAIAIDP